MDEIALLARGEIPGFIGAVVTSLREVRMEPKPVDEPSAGEIVHARGERLFRYQPGAILGVR